MLQDLLEKRLREKYNENQQHYYTYISEWFAYVILTDNKKTITHRFDPPWDCSGEIVNLYEPYNLAEYDTLSDFVSNEYIGYSEATFVSGMGLRYPTYADELEKVTYEYITKLLEFVNADLIKEENVYLHEWLDTFNSQNNTCEDIAFSIENATSISEEIIFEDLIGDFIVFTFPCELQETVLNVSCQELFACGEKAAIERIQREEIEEQNRREKAKQEEKESRQKAEIIYPKVEEKIKKYGIELLSEKITKQLYKQKFSYILEELCEEGVKEEDIRVLSRYSPLNFSTTVSNIIANYTAPTQDNDKQLPLGNMLDFNESTKVCNIKCLLEIGKTICPDDFAVRFYNNSEHPKYYHNRNQLEQAIRRIYAEYPQKQRDIAESIMEKHEPRFVSPRRRPPKKSTKIRIGNCGDAWQLRSRGHDIDIIDHRPFYKNKTTPIGLCSDAPILVLYSERGNIDWEKLLQTKLQDGKLLSNADVKIIHLSDDHYSQLVSRSYVRLSDLKKIL